MYIDGFHEICETSEIYVKHCVWIYSSRILGSKIALILSQRSLWPYESLKAMVFILYQMIFLKATWNSKLHTVTEQLVISRYPWLFEDSFKGRDYRLYKSFFQSLSQRIFYEHIFIFKSKSEADYIQCKYWQPTKAKKLQNLKWNQD